MMKNLRIYIVIIHKKFCEDQILDKTRYPTKKWIFKHKSDPL